MEQIDYDWSTFNPEEEQQTSRLVEASKRIGKTIMRVGAILGISALATTFVGNPEKETENLDIEFTLDYGMPNQGTTAEIPALGGAKIATHKSPIGMRIEATKLNVNGIIDTLSEEDGLEKTVDELTSVSKEGGAELIRNKSIVFLGTLGGAILLGAGIQASKNKKFGESIKQWGVAGTMVLALPLTAGAWTYNTQNENPSVEWYDGFRELNKFASDMNELKDRYETNRDQLSKLVANPMHYIRNVEEAPALPSDSTIVVLVGDQHSQVGVYDLTEQLVEQFDADAVVSVGDEVDQGVPAENVLLSNIEDVDAPYYIVFGNHSGNQNREFVTQLNNVIPLDGSMRRVDGNFTMFGADDPRFTPSENRTINYTAEQRKHLDAATLLPTDQRLLSFLGNLPESRLPHVLVVHDQNAVKQTITTFGDKIPYLFAGHTHKEQVTKQNGVIVINPGSLGGSSYRAFESEDEPDHQTAKVLYFDKKTGILTDIMNVDWGPVNNLGIQITHCKPHQDIEKCNQ